MGSCENITSQVVNIEIQDVRSIDQGYCADMSETVLLLIILAMLVVVIALLVVQSNRQQKMEGRNEEQSRQFRAIEELQRKAREDQIENFAGFQTKLERRFGELQQSIEKRLGEMSKDNIEHSSKSNEKLHETLNQRLNEISGQVEKRLDKGFEKTTETFADVVKRLAMIDAAQKRITELSSNVVNLQEVLSDKRSRGAFGEVQMAALVRDMMPENSFSLQHSLSNGTRVDCLLFLPEPVGNMALDSKFSLESYQRMMDNDLAESDRVSAKRQFKQDIRKHIKDISEKYIIPGETADSAMMFIPAEAVFAEIYAHHPDLVEESHRSRVWMASPTTLMAVLTTVRAVLKDAATRKQVHLIQEHLVALSKDFDRFSGRMENLSRHIQQANKDVEEVNTSARKISSRFEKIEKVELDDTDAVELLEQESE
jgi:DNA recombination protein RmuC